MADGSGPSMCFNFPLPQLSRLRLAEIIIDLFAGGGGAREAGWQIDPTFLLEKHA